MIDKKPEYRYFRFYISSISEFGLSPSETLLLHLIDALSHRKGFAYASKKYLANTLGLTPQSVYRFLKKLEFKGLIIREPYEYGSGKSGEIRPSNKWIDYIQAYRDSSHPSG